MVNNDIKIKCTFQKMQPKLLQSFTVTVIKLHVLDIIFCRIGNVHGCPGVNLTAIISIRSTLHPISLRLFPLARYVCHIVMICIRLATYAYKVHWANIGLIWVLSAPDGPHVGPMNLAIRRIWYESATVSNDCHLIKIFWVILIDRYSKIRSIF